MATSPTVAEIVVVPVGPVPNEPTANEGTKMLMSFASGTAYHKNASQKLKSWLGTKLRGNVKAGTQQAVHFAITHIPFVGPVLAGGFNFAGRKLEEKYRKVQAQKRKGQSETDPDWEKGMRAEINLMTFQNAMAELEKARGKLDRSMNECRNHWSDVQLDSCVACAETFYHWYRLEVRAGKLKLKVAAVIEVLKYFDEYADKHLEVARAGRGELIKKVNEFTDNHPAPHCSSSKLKLTYFKNICVLDPETLNEGQKLRLLENEDNK